MRRSIARVLAIALLPAACIVAAGCGMLSTPSQVRNYYTIDYTPRSSPPPGSRRPYPFVLQVGRFDVERAANRQNIVYRYSPHQLQYYERDRWAVRPEDMIRDMVHKHLEEARLTRSLPREFTDRRPDFRLEGMVDALERLDAGDLFFSHMAMTFKLIKTDTGDEVWSYAFDQRRRVAAAEMVKSVQALSDIFQSQMNIVVTQLDSLFAAASGGVPLVPTPAASAAPPEPEPQPEGPALDESSFEIIRER